MENSTKFELPCGHGRAINRVRVFGFIDYQHADDGSSCELCNKFNTKSAKIAATIADGAPRSIADDSYRAFLLVSPTRRKEYIQWVAGLPVDEFLYEIRLVDRFVVLRHGSNQCLYKLGTEIFNAFGPQLTTAIEFLFPNTYYLKDEKVKRIRYHRYLPYQFSPIKVVIQCYQDLQDMVEKQDQSMAQTPVNMPSAEAGPGTIRFAVAAVTNNATP